MKRRGTAVWDGAGREGKGRLTTPSGALNETRYSHASRFKDEIGTNPEELIAAAHAGCFSMKLAILLADAGFPSDRLEAQSTITLENGVILSSEIQLQAQVPGISNEKFDELVRDAEKNCPVSKLLNAEISVQYQLNA